MTDPPRLQPRHGLFKSFAFAFAGIAHLFRTQRNARIELAIGILACGFAVFLRISRANGECCC